MRGRNSDNTLILERLGWEPSISLEDGLEKTYRWIYEQMTRGGAAARVSSGDYRLVEDRTDEALCRVRSDGSEQPRV